MDSIVIFSLYVHLSILKEQELRPKNKNAPNPSRRKIEGTKSKKEMN